MINVTIIGASGYAGAELVRLLANHGKCRVVHLVAKGSGGRRFEEIYPALGYLSALRGMVVEDVDGDFSPQTAAAVDDADVVFLALPHGASVPFVRACLAKGKRVIDLGADFRFRDVAVYERWYGKHDYPELCAETVYGLVEAHREQIPGQKLIANPGCYVTGATLAMLPLVKAGLVDLNTLIFDSKSGVSGAGRGLKEGSLYGECSESIKAYGVASHRHTPEIEQNLSEAAGRPVTVSFTPHLTPMNRGILATCYAQLKDGVSAEHVQAAYEKHYKEEFFIRLLGCGSFPETRWVEGSNFVDIGFTVDERTRRVIAVGALDNLVKGAAGQAVQNMNIVFGLEETMGLKLVPLFP